MNWLQKLYNKENLIIGKDIRFKYYNNFSDLPENGEENVIYKCRDVDQKYIWIEYDGKMSYVLYLDMPRR